MTATIRFTVVTLFPEALSSFLGASLLGKAIESGTVAVDFVDPRDFTSDVHRTVDDSPYGGGAGMVMKAEPLLAALRSVRAEDGAAHRVFLTPGGARLSQDRVARLAEREHIVLVCGRYEGIDERVNELAIDEQLSLGDFVLAGGESAAIVVIDAVSRLVPGLLGKAESAVDESFTEPLLEYPHYTRPAEVEGRAVPEILLSGDHARIAKWRREQSLARTAARRPDLLAGFAASDDDRALLATIDHPAKRTYVLLAHHPVHDRSGAVVTTSITNLDLHDIARSASTYGLAGYFAITPVTSQREKIERIASVWQGELAEAGEHRAGALSLVEAVPDIAAAIAAIEAREGQRPRVVGTTANTTEGAVAAADLARQLSAEAGPVALLFGTGWGLVEAEIAKCDQVLMPIGGLADFNHLSVRSAVCAVLDRLFGLRASRAP